MSYLSLLLVILIFFFTFCDEAQSGNSAFQTVTEKLTSQLTGKSFQPDVPTARGSSNASNKTNNNFPGRSTNIEQAKESNSYRSIPAVDNAYVPGEILIKFVHDRGEEILSQKIVDSIFSNFMKENPFTKVEKVFDSFGATREEMVQHFEEMRRSYNLRASRAYTQEIPNLHRYFKITLRDKDISLSNLISQLKLSKNIEAVSTNHYLYLSQTTVVPDDPLYRSGNLWGLRKIDVENAWQISQGNWHTLTIAVVDSGIDYTHPDIRAHMWQNPNPSMPGLVGYDFFNDDNDPFDDNKLGHGTHIAGTIAAHTNNKIGIAGVLWHARLMAIKVCGEEMECPLDTIVNGIAGAVNRGADILNLSLVGEQPSQMMRDALLYANSLGTIVVTAAGNTGRIELSQFEPAHFKMGITVGASTSEDQITYFSNIGMGLDVVAPGTSILSLKASNRHLGFRHDYIESDGTSMATPHVTGVVGLLLAADPTLTVENVRQKIRMNADDILSVGWDKGSGWGRLNAYRALTSQSRCEARIEVPFFGSLNFISSPTEIRGTASGQRFAYYTLESSVDGESWQLLTRNNTAVRQQALYSLSSTLQQRLFIRLRVYDNALTNQKPCGEDMTVFFHNNITPASSIVGENNTAFGTSIAIIQDLNRDGFDEILVGAPRGIDKDLRTKGFIDLPPRDRIPTHDKGKVYLIPGNRASYGLNTNITQIQHASWVAEDVDTYFGWKVLPVKDLNGDGLDEILISEPGYSAPNEPVVGKVYLVFGRDLSSLPINEVLRRPLTGGPRRFVSWIGEQEYGLLGFDIAVGDFDADHIEDIALSAIGWRDSSTASSKRGKVYIFYGKNSSTWSRNINISRADVHIQGVAGATLFGSDLSSGKDVDGDGRDDLLVSCGGYNQCVRLILGKNIPHTGIITPGNTSFLGGHRIALVNDVNRDQMDDILIGGAPSLQDVWAFSPSLQFFFGSATPANDYSRSTIYNPLLLTTPMFGAWFSSIGDLNHDGYNDFLVGASPTNHRYDFQRYNQTFIILGASELSGKWSKFESPLYADLKLVPPEGDQSYAYGASASRNEGDINGDGFNDIIISDPYYYTGASADNNTGKIYIYHFLFSAD